MKKIFEITDKNLIFQILSDSEYGTLALSHNDKPYSIPINFVEINNEIYFHGAEKGKKMEFIKSNSYASFSVVEPYSVIQSYFSSDEGAACSATQFFKSIIIDGHIEFIENYNEKIFILQKLMDKLQPEGGYNSLDNSIYKKIINITIIYKLVPELITAKFKFGQNLSDEKFNEIIRHLEKRESDKDIYTAKLMREFR